MPRLKAELPTDPADSFSTEQVLTRNGHTVALLTDFDDEELNWFARERDPEFLASIVRGREQPARGQSVKHEDLKKLLGLE